MSGFAISFSSNANTRKWARGQLELLGEKESFDASLSFWTKADYEMHWQHALSYILDENKPAALITSITDPKNSNFLRWWPMYPLSTIIVFREQLLFLDHLERPFDLKQPFDSVSPFDSVAPRCFTRKQEEKVSEWRIPKKLIKEFLSLPRNPPR